MVTGTNRAPAELLNSYATKSGFRILTWTYTDFRYISNAKRPITKMADMQGLKFRVPQSAVLIAAYKAFVYCNSETVKTVYNILYTALYFTLFIGILNTGVKKRRPLRLRLCG